VSTAYERLADALRAAGCDLSDKGRARCPAHNGNSITSLSVKAIEGSVLLYCHAGCDNDEVLAALNLERRDLFDDPRGAVYCYPDGRRVHRTPGKDFWQKGNTKGRSLFHADQIGYAATVHVVEGEKDVLAIEAAGGDAVCPPQGAGQKHLDRYDWSVLKGKHVRVVVDKDDTGRKHARQVAELLGGIAASVGVVEAADHIAAGRRLDELVTVQCEMQLVTLTRLADVEPERVSWLWPGRIPVGKLVTLDGDPGLGKSTLALSLGAPITTGAQWPDGSICEHPGAVLIMSAEDGLADTVRPRCDAAGVDVTKVHAIEGVPIIDEHGERVLRAPTLADVAALEQAINRTGARLLVIDVVMAYLPTGTDSHKDQDIRRVLSRLAALADRTGCTVLLLRHLNKASGRDPLYRGGGSIGIVGAARAGLLVAPDPDDPERRVLASVKSNLGPTPDSLMYRLVEAGDYGVARVQWEGQTAHTARTLLSEPHDDDDDAKSEAVRWLEDYLAEQGAAPSKTAKADAAKAGIRERTLQRAVNSLGVTVESRGFPRVTWWTLPNGATGLGSQNLGATGATGDDLHKQNGATGPNPQSRQLFETGATGGKPADGRTPDAPDGPVSGHVGMWASGGHVCAVCGQEMLAPTSIERGHCERCSLSLRRDGDAA
jgi:putative DNA primase/helicase